MATIEGRAPFPVDYQVASSPHARATRATIMLLAELTGLIVDRGQLAPALAQHDSWLLWPGFRFRGERFDIESKGKLSRGNPARRLTLQVLYAIICL